MPPRLVGNAQHFDDFGPTESFTDCGPNSKPDADTPDAPTPEPAPTSYGQWISDLFKGNPLTDAFPTPTEFLIPNQKDENSGHDSSTGFFTRFHRPHWHQGKFRVSSFLSIQKRLNQGRENSRIGTLSEITNWWTHLRDFVIAYASYFAGGLIGLVVGSLIIAAKLVAVGRSIYNWWLCPWKDKPSDLLGLQTMNCTDRVAHIRVKRNGLSSSSTFEERRDLIEEQISDDPVINKYTKRE
jgi:hypothetical protein